MILAIETSCDETCAAVCTEDGRLLSSVVASQVADHAAFGGVVPEIAARAHVETIDGIVAQAEQVGTLWADELIAPRFDDVSGGGDAAHLFVRHVDNGQLDRRQDQVAHGR